MKNNNTKIAKLLYSKGIGQSEIARALGITKQAVDDYVSEVKFDDKIQELSIPMAVVLLRKLRPDHYSFQVIGDILHPDKNAGKFTKKRWAEHKFDVFHKEFDLSTAEEIIDLTLEQYRTK